MSLPIAELMSLGTALVEAYKKASRAITSRLRQQADKEADAHVAASKKLAELAKQNLSE